MSTLDGNTTLTAAKFDGNTPLTSAKLNAGAVADVDFSLSEVVETVVADAGTPGAPTIVTDINFTTVTAATTETHSDLLASGNEAFTFVSQDTNIATVNTSGETAWVSDGIARILVKGTDVWQHKNVAVSRAGGQSTATFSSYVTGSFAKFCTDSVDNAISGKTFATNGPLFTTMDHGTATYVRNASAWTTLAGIDCTGISPWNNARTGSQAQWQHGTVLHERIAIFARHYSNPMPVGSTVRFVTAGNVVVDRIVDATASVSNDIWLCRFSEALPGTINIVKVLPSNWRTYLPHISDGTTTGYRVPGFYSEQNKKAYVADLQTVTVNTLWAVPTNATRLLFDKSGGLVVGDSGSPQCLVAGTQLVLVSTAGSATIPNDLTALDAGMDSLISGAATTKIDLSSYNPY